jgi:molybdopterin-containing oxidoreductase family membrane subunit
MAVQRPALRRGGWLAAETVLMVLAVIGVVAFIYQLYQGLAVTNLTDQTPWGLYITTFIFLVGLSAGGLIVASAGEVFGVEKLKPLAPMAIWLSIVCVGLAAVSIIPDMVSPLRIWRLFTNAQLQSPLIWDVAIILFYLSISAIYLWLHVKSEAGGKDGARFQKLVHNMAFIALPAAILVHSITAWIFGLQIARSFWHSALLAPFFISSALVSGLGLMILATLLARRAKVVEIGNNLITWLGGLLAVFIVVDVFFLAAEMLTQTYPGAPEGAPAQVLLTGRLAPLFWTEVLFGILVPFVILAVRKWRQNVNLVALASILAIGGILIKRFNLVSAGYAYPFAHLPSGVRVGQSLPDVGGTHSVWVFNSGPFQLSWTYSPAPVEVAIVVGMLAAGILLFMIGLQIIPFKKHAN